MKLPRQRSHQRPNSTQPPRHERRPFKRASEDLKQISRWMQFHEQALMPARERGGADEIRRILLQARSDGLMNMTEAQIEQEISDVLSAPSTKDSAEKA